MACGSKALSTVFQRMDEKERMCAMEPHLLWKRFPPPADSDPGG